MTILPVFVSFSLLLASLGVPVPHQPTRNDSGVAFREAEGLRDGRKYQEAIDAYTDAVRIDPHDFRAYIGLAHTYFSLGQQNLAYEDMDRAVQVAPTRYEPLDFRAEQHYFHDEYAEAVTDLDAAIRLQPDCTDLYRWRGCAHAALGHYELALADLTQVIDRSRSNNNPYESWDYVRRATVERLLGRTGPALADYAKGDSAIMEGEYLLDLGRYPEAFKVFDDLLRSLGTEREGIPDPTQSEHTYVYFQAHYDRALARVGLKTFDGVTADLEAYTAGQPHDAGTYGNVAWVLLLADHAAEARVAAMQGLVLDGKLDYIRLHLAHAYLLGGKLEQAQAIYLDSTDIPAEDRTARIQSVRDDFAAFRAAGIDRPGMAAIEALVSKSPTPQSSSAPPLDMSPCSGRELWVTKHGAPKPSAVSTAR